MTAIGRRMHRLRQTLDVQYGRGAAILPPEVTRLHLNFAYGLNGHVGPRRFAREYLPRLKYWNPSIPMVVNRHNLTIRGATLSAYMRDTKAEGIEPVSNFIPKNSIYPIYPIPSDASQRLLNSSITKESPAPQAAPGEKVIQIGMKKKWSTEILHEFYQVTKAKTVNPPPNEKQEKEELRLLAQRSSKCRKMAFERNEKRQKEEEHQRKLAARVAESMAQISQEASKPKMKRK